jgi:N-acetylmuramoyl-L-alanine amidase
MDDVTLTNLTDQEALTLTLFGEGRGENIAGLVAIGAVIRNRLHSGKYPSYKAVVLAPKQFSCWNTTDPNYQILIEHAKQMLSGSPSNDPYFQRCAWVARGIMEWILFDETRGAEFYMTSKLFLSSDCPSWARKLRNIVTIGSQVFGVL